MNIIHKILYKFIAKPLVEMATDTYYVRRYFREELRKLYPKVRKKAGAGKPNANYYQGYIAGLQRLEGILDKYEREIMTALLKKRQMEKEDGKERH